MCPRPSCSKLTGLFDELGLHRPNLAGSSLGGRIALEAAEKRPSRSVTAIAPAGFWRTARELAYARGNPEGHAGGRTLAEPLGPALSRSTAGRALIYAAIVSRPSQVTPEQASGDMAAFLAARSAEDAILAAAAPVYRHHPRRYPGNDRLGYPDHLLWPRQAQVAKARHAASEPGYVAGLRTCADDG